MGRTITIKMSVTDALAANSILSAELRDDKQFKNNYLARGEDAPNWIEREIEELGRVVQILNEAITDQ